MAEQFRLLSETTVAVSPCGGVSMILPFLPPGAYAVLLNYMLGPGEAQARQPASCWGVLEDPLCSPRSSLWRPPALTSTNSDAVGTRRKF